MAGGTEAAAGRSRGAALAWSAAILLGFALRAVPLTAARPYMAYVDEGNFLHAAFRMIRDGTWDPRQYVYPQFPLMAVAAAGRIEDGLGRLFGRPSLRDRVPRRIEMYDELEPFAFLATARAMSLVSGLALVVLAGLFARRLAGPAAGGAAALLAATVPALVLRGSIASVDSYAALAATAALVVTDRTRTSRRAVLTAFAAGGLAGAAFASKYPAVLVFVAFVVTSLLLPVAPRERIRRLLSGAAGLVAGALAAMPALARHAREIPPVLLGHWSGYTGKVAESSLWRQALVRAESSLRYDGPELGIAFVLLALIGIVAATRRRDLVPTVAGWGAFAAVLFVLFGTPGFRPFRNLLPLVPLACVAAGIGYAEIRSRVRRPAAVDAAAVLLLAVFFVAPMAAYAKSRFELRDPRRVAIDWLADKARSQDRIVVARELAILDGELARVPAQVEGASWDEAPSRIRDEAPRFVVAGVLMRRDRSLDDALAWPALADYRPVLRAGGTSTVPFPDWWHGNDQIVVVFERKGPK
jgi:4-amino-4-deoxy-L-arabinose transferase-like glycosyltransferase